MSEGVVIGGLLAIILGLAIQAIVGAIFLRAGIALFNRLAGDRSSGNAVPEPTFGRAMLITLVTAVAQFAIDLLIGLVAMSGDPQEPQRAVQVVSAVASLLVMVGLLSAMLPTTWGRAFLVMLCTVVVGLLVGLVLGAIVVLVSALGSR